MTIFRSRIALLLLALLAAPALSPQPASAVDRILILAASDSVIDIERDLDCVAVNLSDAAGTQTVAVANANTTKIQTALDLMAEVSGTHYVMVIPNKCFAVGTTTINLPSGVAIVGAGGICRWAPESARVGATASPNGYINGPKLMRVTPSSNPIFKTTGYGVTVSNICLAGAFYLNEWPHMDAFRNSGVADPPDPYFAGVGIEINNTGNGGGIGPVSGHHTIDCAIEFCTIGVKFTYTTEENQADVCTFPRLEMNECDTGIYIDNEQSIAHDFGHIYYQAPTISNAGVFAPSKVFNIQRGGRIHIDALAVVGACTVVNTGTQTTNTGAVTIDHIYCDANCFRNGDGSGRFFRLLDMSDGAGTQDFYFRCTGAFSWGVTSGLMPPGLASQWYNTNGSSIFLAHDGSSIEGTDLDSVNIDCDIYGMSNQDAMRYGRPRAMPAATALTIDTNGDLTGAGAIRQSFHSVDTFGGASSDDLDTIDVGVEGFVLTIRAANSARTVVVKDAAGGAGNIECAGDFSLDNAQDTITLQFDGTDWIEVSRVDGGA